MRLPMIPAARLLWILCSSTAAALLVLLFGAPMRLVATATGIGLGVLSIAAILDLWHSWRAWQAQPARLVRRLPPALAIGVRRPIRIALDHEGSLTWQLQIHDHADPSLQTDGMPASLQLSPGRRSELEYHVLPTSRGACRFQPAELRVTSRFGLWQLLTRIGSEEIVNVYPDFAQVARYAWLAGDRRLQEIGIKNTRQRGAGTDFRQLEEYRLGDPVRHIDWKATQRQHKIIVRQFQEDRDQCVWLLLDCGRRMRADDRTARLGASHFDQVLNAVMLLSYVALREGDAVGAATFGTAANQRKIIAPRKGVHAMNALMAQIFDAQPGTAQPDYLAAAQEFLRRQPKRSLVVILTNFRDEDCVELTQALQLLRARHLVLVASLRERVVADLIGQPLATAEAALEVASGHLHAQARQDAFAQLAARDALMVDAEPEQLGVELVNRYHAAKRAGMI